MSDSPQDSPRPVMLPRLQAIIDAGVAVSAVLDVGVLSSTEFLISCFPTVPHLLFEPVDSYFEVIRTRYANLRYQLVHVALSDRDGTAWQIGISKDGSGRVTHSRLSDVEVRAGEQLEVVECKPVRKARLDTVMKEIDQQGPYLLKIDVDGHEIPVLNGATETFRNVSILIVEASVGTIRSKLDLAESSGFELFDIVDPCYYYGVLSQVDLIFIRSEWISRCRDLAPWESKVFAWTAWHRFE